MIFYGLYRSPLGPITVAKDEKGFLMLDFCECIEKESLDNSLFTDFFYKLDKYFEGEKVDLKEPLSLNVNQFRLRVFKETMKVPWGRIKTYKEIALAIDSSPRAVGVALSKNPVLLIIPCHRIVGEKNIGGYSRGVEIKRKLLEIEGIKYPENV
ncbi:methylated-DNA--[protein]-cysteine S-methyltransferase [Acidianus brierleyi]|uniref:Methylated-DNA--protein-cysteine methyltransferase n=1 Tax=Acidianus brierleyi TaxID=41673 RepID=A0A2U9IGA5_9CREN|nr:methylated-DNA--[protein]-cysteine S-methyltransferase [Acidianus brierleyi]AWR95092.1 methylated-DNA--[protein]-cysteine S-methyltransferase [Acidianus brierleyi]